MDIIKIRYTFRHKGSGNIEMKWYSIGQLEERAAAKLSPVFSDEYELISRDLYTGLKDKNGREIYEGDLIKWDEKEWGSQFIEVVKWDYEQLHSRKNDWSQFCHVIGNIYEKPELLEAAE
ncbi:YopX family protein [Bacillus subtilis]|uniref:YopX family protein n=1 Tax=Bacillus subtilis TaxID=1423 RepID=UPI00142FA38E|nr:YopX family protein [Bacillus subtilis]NJI50552.1 hypothetical protein [Bacillus subtilis]